MKMCRFISMVICVCLLLTACGTEETQIFAYQYGNMQQSAPSGNFMRYNDSVFFTAFGDDRDNLYVYDVESGDVSLFCQDPTCLHDTDECASRGLNCNLEQYEGKLYGSNSDGPVMQLQGGRFQPLSEDGVNHFFHYDGDLYVQTLDYSLLVYENGKSRPRMVLEEFAGQWETIFDGYLYFYESSNVNRINLEEDDAEREILLENCLYMTDGIHIYYTPMDTYYLYRCNMDGSEPALIVEQPILIKWSNFDDEYVYFRLYPNMELEGEGSNQLYRFPKANPTQTELIAELDVPLGCVYTVPEFDGIFIDTYEPLKDDGTRSGFIYTVGKDGNHLTKLELPQI